MQRALRLAGAVGGGGAANGAAHTYASRCTCTDVEMYASYTSTTFIVVLAPVSAAVHRDYHVRVVCRARALSTARDTDDTGTSTSTSSTFEHPV